MQQEKRNVNFELLRIISILAVLTNHFFIHGISIYPDEEGFTTFNVSSLSGMTLWGTLQIMNLLALFCVNCFILISGYFTIEKTGFSWKRIFRVWSMTWTYSVTFAILLIIIGIKELSPTFVFESLTPLWHNTYWFITSYLALSAVAPFLSRLVSGISHRQYLILLGIGFLFTFQFLLGRFCMDGNYFSLFCYLYLLGGYVRRYYDTLRISPRTEIASFLTILLLMFAVAFVKNNVNGNQDFLIYCMAYHGLPLPLSVTVFLIVRRIRIPRTVHYIIFLLAPLTLASYIIQSHPVISDLLWGEVYRILRHVSPYLWPLMCILSVVVIFLACSCIEYLRRQLPKLKTIFFK